ncbi:WXG100 family type VII secretion target [Micromonospora sp. NPDC049366]|uniref:WXG100 family type VII secretion target n=1 Tax=Micromonospora sp. NPDC049366 TaxID=3364271 RepID=UPI0037A72F6B
MPVGTTYSSASPEAELKMDITDFWAAGRVTIPGHAEELIDALDRISDALGSIEVNWVGESQRAAQDLNDRWRACTTALFGTRENPGAGILNRIAGGMQGAALNLDTVETKIIELWQQYIDLMSQMLAMKDEGSEGEPSTETEPISQV